MQAKTKRQAGEAPAHPGRAIVEDVLAPYTLTQEQLAKLTGVSRRTINQLVNRRRNLTADMALRIARVTGTDARVWLERQIDWDLWQAERDGAGVLASLRPLERAVPDLVEVEREPPPPDVLPVKKAKDKKPKDKKAKDKKAKDKKPEAKKKKK